LKVVLEGLMGYSAPNEVRLIMTHRAINSGNASNSSIKN